MKYLLITNKGEVDPLALTLLGASTKRGDETQIGMFGSGNKYAIAYLLRHNIALRILSGTQEIELSTVTKNFRDNSFEVITVNGQETSITTETGPKWKLWEAIREIYSNAKDEGGETMDLTDKITSPGPGYTSFYILLTNEVREIYENIGDYFAIDKETLFETDRGKIYKKTSNKALVYRKGIRCISGEEMSTIFDYDLNYLDLNESREASYSWQIPEEMYKVLYPCSDEDLIRQFYHNMSKRTETLEHEIGSSMVRTDASSMSEAWRTAIPARYIAPNVIEGFLDNMELVNTIILPEGLYKDLVERFGEEITTPALRKTKRGNIYKTASPTPLQIQILRDVLAFFELVNYEIECPIDIVDFKDPNTHGTIEDGKILLGTRAFDNGKAWVANTIIEEKIHLKYEAGDKSLAFQNAAISELITYMQEAHTIAL